MRRPLLPLARLTACAVLSLAACAPSPKSAPRAAEAPRYRTVHIDTLAPEKAAQFEAARREWVEELRRAHASDLRGLFLQVDRDRFYTIRPFATFASLDTR